MSSLEENKELEASNIWCCQTVKIRLQDMEFDCIGSWSVFHEGVYDLI